MAEEIAFENGRISDFQGLVTLTLDRVILHTVMHHSSISTYIPDFIEIDKTFCGRMDGRTYRWTFETHFIRSTHRRSRPKNYPKKKLKQKTNMPPLWFDFGAIYTSVRTFLVALSKESVSA